MHKSVLKAKFDKQIWACFSPTKIMDIQCQGTFCKTDEPKLGHCLQETQELNYDEP